MKTKFNGILTLFLAFIVQITFAQEKTISGTVSDETGPLPGVSIMKKGTSQGTETDFDGKYSIKAKTGDILVFSFVGMKSEFKTVGDSSNINITMVNDNVLDEVVVTALGITKQEKSLGFSVGTVDSESLTKARSASPIDALSGKVSGLKITQQSGTPGGSASVIIRGATSLSGNNQPIFVVDGLPISNQSVNLDGITGNVDPGSRAGDINPDDIESVSVLKGASAAALYGSRARNGAIIITTKKGKKGSGLSVTFNSSLRVDTALKLPEYQNEYAQGTLGAYDKDLVNGWGPNIANVQGQTFEDFKGDQVTLSAKPDNVKNFFKNGLTKINSISVSGGDDKSNIRLSYTNTDIDGIIPNNTYKKNNYSLNVGRQFTDKLSSSVSVNYVHSNSLGRTQQGSNDPNVVIPDILGISRTISFEDLENNYVDEAGTQIGLTERANNPYWVLNNNPFSTRLSRVFGNAKLTYDLTDNISITNRIGLDQYNEDRQKLYSVGTIGLLSGEFENNDIFNEIINNDLYISYNESFGNKLNVSALLGYNIYQTKYERSTVNAANLTVPGLYSYANAESQVASNFSSKSKLYGVYAEVNLDYDDTYFLTFTGRNDWSSTLPVDNNSYFYPSVNGAIVFSEFFEKNSILNFGKIRGGYAEVGSAADPYQLEFGYSPSTDYFVQYSLSNNIPQGGIIGFEAPATLPNNQLVPQRKNEFEVGLDLTLFNKIVDLNFTYYNSVTKNQIVDIGVPLSTGFFRNVINAGSVKNSGIELDLNISPLKSLNTPFQWDLGIVFNKNTQTLTELTDDLDVYQISSGWSGLTVRAPVDEPFALYGTAFRRNDAGEYIINADTGLKEVESGQNLGEINPDFTMGINNSFRYKGFSLNFLVDIKQGGVLFSGTTASLRSSGLAIETLENRGETFIDTGVNEVIATDGSVTYQENSTAVASIEDYWGNQSSTSNTEGNIFDASYIKLREIAFSYSLPSKLLDNSFFTNVQFGIEGRNLWIIKDHVPHIDPEVNFFGTGGVGSTVEFGSVPSTRSIGLNLKLKF